MPEKIANFVPQDVVFFQTIYDEWGRKKAETLRSLGYRVEVMWERTDEQRFSSGTQVRERMARGGEWESLMPKAAARYIKQHRLTERVKEKSEEKTQI